MGLKEMRKAAGLKQPEAAEMFGLKHRTYQNYENGVTSPTMETAADFARYFCCSIGDLFDLDEGVKPINDEYEELAEVYGQLSKDKKELLLSLAKAMVD